ncbi:MAG: ompa/motb domain protein, partial [Chitinophagaceae bacterium]|nr:ompa/motb domain protein [Chitinophagaceae bacterium]
MISDMRRNVYLLLLLISCGINLQFVQAQHKNIFSLTQSTFKQGEKYFRQGDYMTAITFYEKALQKDRRKQGVIKLRMANSYCLLHHTKEAEFWYKDIMNTKSIVGQQDVLNYAQVLLSNRKYEASKAWFEHYNKEYGTDTLVLKKIEGIHQLPAYYEDSLTRPVHRLYINTVYSEFCPVFYDKGIIFTSSRQSASIVKLNNTKNNNAFLDLYYSELNADKSLSDPKPWRHAASSAYHEGPIAFYNNQTKAIFTQNFSLRKKQEKTDTRHLGLFNIEKTGENNWSDAIALPFNNIHYSVAHAAVTSTGETIYFSSNMPGGYGGTDLYVVHRQEGSWSIPVNLGTTINTSGNELFPSLFQDSILYFSSTGHAGLGGLDIYYTRVHRGRFSSPEIIGYPINSSQDDFGIVFDKDHKSGYL